MADALLLAATSSNSAAASSAGEIVSIAVLVYVLYKQRQIRPLRVDVRGPPALKRTSGSALARRAWRHLVHRLVGRGGAVERRQGEVSREPGGGWCK